VLRITTLFLADTAAVLVVVAECGIPVEYGLAVAYAQVHHIVGTLETEAERELVAVVVTEPVVHKIHSMPGKHDCSLN